MYVELPGWRQKVKNEHREMRRGSGGEMVVVETSISGKKKKKKKISANLVNPMPYRVHVPGIDKSIAMSWRDMTVQHDNFAL